MNTVTLQPETNFIYTLFLWSASNCAPNRDGGTGEIRQDRRRRVFITQESFHQNIKNGVFFSRQASNETSRPRAELLGCKNDYVGALTLKGALKNLLERIAANLGVTYSDLTGDHKQEVFLQSFDLPMFGFVNSNGLEHEALPESMTGSTGLLYLPTTVSQVELENRGISNSFAQPKSSSDDTAKGMPGSHFTDYLVEGVFSTLGILNVKQLELFAQKKGFFDIQDKDIIRKRIAELYNIYLEGVWEGYKLLGYASTMRKGQQPLSLLSAQRSTLPDYISNPADLLMENDILPVHRSIPDTLEKLHAVLPKWMTNISSEWQTVAGQEVSSYARPLASVS